MKILKFFYHRFKALSYEEQKQLAVSPKIKDRLTLASSSQTHKEILFYLAEHDPSEHVRLKVARNPLTPLQANEILAVDGHEDVRLALCARLVALLPELSRDKQSQLYAFTVQALGTLALDEVLKIRKSLAATLKDTIYAPPTVAAQLARDIERDVAEPILRFCAALRDEDIIEIIKTHPADWATEAVAQRKTISALLSRAIIATDNPKAGQYLIENKGAVVDEDTLYDIIERAKTFPEWHRPLIQNHRLSEKMARQLARYADSQIRQLLEKKGGFDLSDVEFVADVTRRRVKLQEQIDHRNEKLLSLQLQEFLKKLPLDETKLADHLALRDDVFIYEVLSRLLKVPTHQIQKVIALKKAETICAVCWKAGLSMRFAFRLQQDMAGISSKELIVPKDGSDYPLSVKDMQWHLEFLDIQ